MDIDSFSSDYQELVSLEARLNESDITLDEMRDLEDSLW